MAEVHHYQDSAEEDVPSCDMSRKRKFDQLNLQTNVASPKDNASEELFSKCQQIDFEAAFQIPDIRRRRNGVVIAELGRKGTDWGNTTCPMCRLFATVRAPSVESSLADTSHYHLRALSFLKATESVVTSSVLPEPLRKVDRSCLLVLSGKGRSRRSSPGQQSLKALIGDTQSYGVIYPIVSSATESSPHFGTRRLLPDCVDYQLLREWHDFCAQNHRQTCATESKEYPEMLKVIDCRTRRIIEAPPSCSYVALSYVWGKQESTTVASDTMPSVISDAMIVTLELGSQYLWVDRYCIDQNDEEKHFQISQMDKVYLCAVTTIVAAAGEGANYGLPGVSNTLRRAQPYAVVRGQLLASTMRTSRLAIGRSRWATRGWTYQEAALSRKRLVFTDDQVFFECRVMSCSESHSVPLALLHRKKLGTGCRSSIRRGFFERQRLKDYGNTKTKFWNAVEQFTARELSYETDSLNAFIGVANYYKNGQGSQSSPLYTHIGLPLDDTGKPSSYGDEFFRGLLWSHFGVPELPKRRRGLPSFSWAGWEGIAIRPSTSVMSIEARIVRDHGTNPELSTPLGTTLDLEVDIVQGQIEVSDKSDSEGLHTRFCLTKWENSGQEHFQSRDVVLPRDFLSRHKLSGGQIFFVDCVEMGYGSTILVDPFLFLMLIEYHGAIAERIGLTQFRVASYEELHAVPKTRRRICLG